LGAESLNDLMEGADSIAWDVSDSPAGHEDSNSISVVSVESISFQDRGDSIDQRAFLIATTANGLQRVLIMALPWDLLPTTRCERGNLEP